jgi:hypothetical protein
MAKKKKEEPIVDNKTGSLKVKEKQEVQPTGNETKGNVTKVKEKMKMKSQVVEETMIKVDLNKPSKPEENETKEDGIDSGGVVASTEDANSTQKQEEVQPEVQTQETQVLEEITVKGEDQEVTVEAAAETVAEAIIENLETGEPLPENIQKLMSFMEDTGGDLNDYVKLNQDYSELDNQDLLHEYYKQTKPHLNNEEINFLMEDNFSFDEDVDEDRDIRRKKLALKEQVASAKSHLDGQKSKYYDEIKSGSKLTNEQQEAINFYKESQKTAEYEKSAKSNFLNRTNKFFGDEFKGFEYNVGDKNYRFNVNDVNKTKETQSDINNFIGKFLDKNRQMADEAGYHKSLFTAMNSDAVAKHFYEQGKADALKQSITESKNIDMEPRQELNKNFNAGGIKARVLGDTTADFKFKIKNKK